MLIRTRLTIIVLALAAFTIALSGREFILAMEKKQEAVFAQQSSQTVDLLLTAAGSWAVERGVTNSALNDAAPVSQKMLENILKRRETGNQAFLKALAELEQYDFEGRAEYTAQLSELFEAQQVMRSDAQSAIQQYGYQRDSGLKDRWVPAMTRLIMLSQDLRFALTRKMLQENPELGRQAQLRHFAWVMSEYAGRERAILGGVLAANQPIPEGKKSTLLVNRGQLELGWEIVQKLGNLSNPNVQDAITTASQTFFGDFEGLRQAIFRASQAELAYPVNASEWIRRSTEAIDTILAIQKASTDEKVLYTSELLASANRDITINGVILVVCLLLSLYAGYFIKRGVSGPLNEMSDAMNRVAAGDTSVEIPGLGRSDEIGHMAESVEVFKRNAIERKQMREQQKALQEQARRDKKQAMEALAKSFEDRVQGIIQGVASAATELSKTAENMTSVIGQSNNKVQSAAASASETSTNVQSVASAAEEMTATVQEISRQVHRSTELVSQSTNVVEQADSHATQLLNASNKVQQVIELISDISGQINLLALNATIESARAGEAGKGFAVVAGEVKNLANETDKSIQEITKVISEMNAASDNIAKSLGAIKTTVADISESSNSIASAVEEQSATTNEIAHNMQTAAHGTGMITGSLGEVGEASSDASDAAKQVLEASTELSHQAETLELQVKEFMQEIRSSSDSDAA